MVMGTGANDVTSMSCLSRVIQLSDNGVSIEGDPKHANILMEDWRMNNE